MYWKAQETYFFFFACPPRTEGGARSAQSSGDKGGAALPQVSPVALQLPMNRLGERIFSLKALVSPGEASGSRGQDGWGQRVHADEKGASVSRAWNPRGALTLRGPAASGIRPLQVHAHISEEEDGMNPYNPF